MRSPLRLGLLPTSVVSLAPNALRVLDQLGLWEDLRGQGRLFEDVYMVSVRLFIRCQVIYRTPRLLVLSPRLRVTDPSQVTNGGSTLATFKNGSVEAYDYPVLRLRRSRLHDTLLTRLAKHPAHAVTIHMGTKITDVSTTDSSATITTSNGNKVTADYVIGADGIHSTVRRFVSPHCAEPLFQGIVSIGSIVPISMLAPYPLPSLVFGRTGTVGLMPCGAPGEDVASFFVTLEVDRERDRTGWQAMRSSGEALRMAETKVEGWGGLPYLLKELEKDPNSCLLWPQYMVPELTHWYRHRVILIGDAAHAIPPSGGQGAAQAFEDAALLARCLAEQGSLEKWEAERKRRIQVVKRFTAESGDARKVGKASWLAFKIKMWEIWAYFRFFGGGEKGDLYMYDGSKADIA